LEKSEEIVFKSHFITFRYVGYTACFLFGCLLVVGSWFIHEMTWFALLYANICGLIFMSSLLLFFWSINEVVIGPDGITITRFRKKIHIANETIDEIWILGKSVMYMYIKTHPKNALSLGERIHIFENNPYPFLLLPLKQELLSRYGKQKLRQELPDKVT
jgi:hypothetical protein